MGPVLHKWAVQGGVGMGCGWCPPGLAGGWGCGQRQAAQCGSQAPRTMVIQSQGEGLLARCNPQMLSTHSAHTWGGVSAGASPQANAECCVWGAAVWVVRCVG